MVTLLASAVAGTLILAADNSLLLGDDFLPWIVLAFGAAMAVGNGLALVRPPRHVEGEPDLPKPSPGRAIAMIAIGAVAALWGAASLLS